MLAKYMQKLLANFVILQYSLIIVEVQCGTYTSYRQTTQAAPGSPRQAAPARQPRPGSPRQPKAAPVSPSKPQAAPYSETILKLVCLLLATILPTAVVK